MKVFELLEWGKLQLKQATDPRFVAHASPTLDAEVLLSHALACSKTKLITMINDEVDAADEDAFRSLISRRLAGEPVAYITGFKWFYKRKFHVTRDTLIPRPETEGLVEEALHAIENQPSCSIIDIGTGPGTIAITLAAETRKPVLACDISEAALEIAKENAQALNVQELLQFYQGNLFEPLASPLTSNPPKHTVITANLPYIPTKQWEEAQPEVREYEPKLALEAGYYGLDLYWLLFRQLLQYREILGRHCTVLIEINPSQEKRIVDVIHESFPNAKIQIHSDLSAQPRIVTTQI